MSGRIRWALSALLVLVVFVCSGFTASASWALLLFHAGGEATGGPNAGFLFIKAIGFSALLTLSAVGLVLLKRRKPALTEIDPARNFVWDWRSLLPLIIVVTFVSVASGTRLSEYPHIEPDEAHHLIVSRNIAMHGIYGSGMPSTGFRPFDDYDSVGPTVLVPVAASIWVFGEPFEAGRLAMAAFYILLTVVAFVFLAQTATPITAAIGAGLMLLAPGSLYIARTLYGEAPALMYLLAALAVWGRALNAAKPALPCALAGALFGCALVTKYFLVVAAWPAVGTWVYDYMTYRRIRPIHAVLPTGVALGVLGVWLTITSVYGPHGSATAEGHLAMYQHNLLFGFDSVGNTLGWLAQHWIATLVFLGVGLVSAGVTAIKSAYNPAWLFLVLFAIFNTYWWIFFTTGNIPRYLCYSMAIGALFAGSTLECLAKSRSMPNKNVRGIAHLFGVMMIALVTWDAVPRFRAMVTRDEMRDEHALLYALMNDYSGKNVATTYYPIERIANLFGELPVTRVGMNGNWANYDAVVIDRLSQSYIPQSQILRNTIGRYTIIQPAKE